MGTDQDFLPVWCVRDRSMKCCLALGMQQVEETLSWTNKLMCICIASKRSTGTVLFNPPIHTLTQSHPTTS